MDDRSTSKWAAELRSCRQWTRDQARELLQRQQRSGETVTRFARRMGLEPKRVLQWRRRLGMGQPRGNARSRALESACEFVPVQVRGAQPIEIGSALLVVTIGEQLRVEVHRADASTAGWVALLAVGCAKGVGL